ncbi:hypothetical protein WR25_22273 [Diploscapter pachys]|uniref:ZP domain-containing protein n=1 Tax=Diploscapter pachys TaxID=2018661 RepID=A0A2A2L5A9_9BILA|nr:hypothetical protein WR25_22273 [Diploscapter pachys]
MSIQWSILQLLAASVLALCHSLECAAINHHPSPDGFSHHCDVFQPHQLQNVDGYVEADDRYSFYWKYCLNSTRKCGGDYAFTYLSDRYMDGKEIKRISKKSSLEECLTECIEETAFACRSISFNRTDGGCHLSDESQLTKPRSIRLNNNPNFRIDYYENNCYNLSETFKFEQQCLEDGVIVKVKSKFPYTGAFYGIYDFFSCRIEPKQQKEFELFFPSPAASKNCSESIRFKGDEMILEVVLSTDGIEPLYFITPDDLTYQAKCPIMGQMKQRQLETNQILAEDAKKEMTASAHALFSMLAKEDVLKGHGEPIETTTKALQKDTYPLPLTSTPMPIRNSTTSSSSSTTTTTTTTTTPKRHEVTRSVNTVNTVQTHQQSNHSNPPPTPASSVKPKTTTTELKPPIYVKMSDEALRNAHSTSTTAKSTTTSQTATSRTTTTSSTVKPSSSSTTTTTSTQSTTTQTSSVPPLTTTQKISVPTYQPFVPISQSQVLTTSTSSPRPTEVVMTEPTTRRIEESSTSSQVTSTTTRIIPPSTTPPNLKPSFGQAMPPSPAPSHNETIPEEKFPSGVVKPRQPVQFDIYHNGHAVEAVVVGSKVTLAFTPHYAISPDYMSLQKCQIEPIDPRYEWEREPVRIIDDGCPSDLVGLACPPTHSEYGIKVTVESFRYQTTPQIQYSCLIRICPFAPCPTNMCHPVDGCATRRLRDIVADGLPLTNPNANFNEQQLLALGGEHFVKRRLVVVNSEDQLRYYVRTGDLP